ncbi:MAG: FecR domain-containing protein [Candidatus Lambdaproteobacteria bacterium]|nr:FecR domain-containing protein [Candidatus Lambdaproteobacteria bacterium]
MSARSLLAAAIGLALLLALEARAAEPAGEVLLQRGLLKVRRVEVEHIYQKPGERIPLFETDVVHTGENSRATVTLYANRDTIAMYSNSFLRVATARREDSVLALNVGKALFAFARRLAEQRAQVLTPTATLGVKGTEFIAGATETESYVLTLEGVVGVVSKAEPEREVNVTKDMLYYVTPQAVPKAPLPVSPVTRERVLKEEGLDTLRQVGPEAGTATAPAPRRPIAFLRFGLAPLTTTIPFRDAQRQDHRRTVTGQGALLALELRLLGPLTLEALGVGGGVTGATSEAPDPAAATTDPGGRTTTLALLLGLRFTLGDSWSFAAHAGPFANWTGLNEAAPGSAPQTLNLRGGMARVALDYWFQNRGTLGIALHGGSATPQGTEVERLHGLGLETGTATHTFAALTLGGRF